MVRSELSTKPFTSHCNRKLNKSDELDLTHFKHNKNVLELNHERKGIDLCSSVVKKIKLSRDTIRKSESDFHLDNI